jgi:cyclic beta-1,2-glucan synthetase
MTQTVPLAPALSEPMSGSLYSIETLETFARTLATSHRVLPGENNRGKPLLRRLKENGRALLAANRSIVDAVRAEHAISPAAEWFVDNFPVVDEQLREIVDDLPKGFYRELPKLAAGPLEGHPRVYALALALVEHTDSRLDAETLARFVRSYQCVHALTIGELWAIAISLRLVLVENLRRIADQIVLRRIARGSADSLASVLLGTGGASIDEGRRELRRLDREPLSGAFLVQLIQRLRDRDPADTPGLVWLNERLAKEGKSSDELVAAEHRSQVATHVTVRNVITSMRLLSSLDWSDFFESVSLVEEALRAGTDVAANDFATRDRYRKAVEELARGSGLPELEIARRAAARARASTTPGERRADPGYYLISRGRLDFEKELGFRPRLRQALRRAYVMHATPGFLGTIAILTGAVLVVPFLLAGARGATPGELGLFLLLAFVPATEIVIAIVNRSVTSLVGPRRLATLALKDGVPGSMRTLLVVPTLLSSAHDVEDQLEKLEVHFLSNGDGDVRFAILSDFTDAATEKTPGDDAVRDAAVRGVAELNRRHPVAEGGPRFLFLQRRRLWNASEGVWMGWERKRGKLHELNRLLRGAVDTTFVDETGAQPSVPAGVRFVITLDADTRLPRGAAVKLVGTIDHPLNRPVYDRAKGRVVEGHAILQPHVKPLLPEQGKGTLYQRIFSGPSGMDPYAFAVSDVYQDLFGEGIYTGKGIYDVDAFAEALDGRTPENTLLSHDLFEGIFARTGLVTDIELFDEAPACQAVGAARRHRWARGDWQLLPWILGRRSAADKTAGRDPIPAIGRWKMIDNLRRTLVAPASFLLLAAAFALPAERALVWIGFVAATIFGPHILPALDAFVPRRRGIAKRTFVRGAGTDLAVAVFQSTFALVQLAPEAWLMGDAIARTLTRLYVTRRRRLEWVTAARSKIGLDRKLEAFFGRMVGGVALAIGAAAIAAVRHTDLLWLELALPVLWILSPALARWMSIPPPPEEAEVLSPTDERLLRSIARRTWRFFERFVGAEDNALPPDNFQEDPRPEIAHRTSPTNIGLYLLSAISAHDLGWLGTLDLIERLESTFATLSRLAGHRGHFYNWYDTRSLAPLEPRYVSTVDSGNLAGHLIAVRQACLELAQAAGPPRSERSLGGIRDTLEIVRQVDRATADDRPGDAARRRRLAGAIAAVEERLALAPGPGGQAAFFAELAGCATAVVDAAEAVVAGLGSDHALLEWARTVGRTIASHALDFPGKGAPEATRLASRLTHLAARANEISVRMDFRFLFQPVRKLFAIGFDVSAGRLDGNCYDLLASEARLTSFVAIARGVVPASHWFRLGRPMTPVGFGSALVSWSGSMFEYLMPELVMTVPPGSLLAETDHLAVVRQIAYGRERGIPWGVSESAYNVRDIHDTYQYSNFGVSGLGLKRGLGDNVVIAPYASALAAMVAPVAALRNLARLGTAGALGRYGFYDAIDFTKERLPEGKRSAVIRAYMAHHQGMSIVAIANVLTGELMRRRFHAEPIVQAAQLLLQERTPRDIAVARPGAGDLGTDLHVRDPVLPVLRHFESPHEKTPRTHLLSNGRYSVMVTAAGSGYSRWQGLALTRWREDPTRDPWGSYVYIRDAITGKLWSATHQPVGVEADSYSVSYCEHRALFRRRDDGLETTVEVVVSPEDDAELRQVSLTNHGLRAREIELTSYAEVVLAPQQADVSHPAFSNLFVQTEFVPELGALVATRRPRSAEETPVWAAHLVCVEGPSTGTLEYETDRARFLGRGHDASRPGAVVDGVALSGTTGSVLDPIFSLRRRVKIAGGATVRVTFSTLVAGTREKLLALADKYRSPSVFDRTTTLAWAQAQVQLRHQGITPDEAQLFQRLATYVLYSDRAFRAPHDLLARSERGRSGLWAHGISGDRPIVLVTIADHEEQKIISQLLHAQEYWRMKGLAVDLVILNEEAHSYDQGLQTTLERLARSSPRDSKEREGTVFVLKTATLSAEDRDALRTAARVVLHLRHGTLDDQVVALLRTEPAQRPKQATAPARPAGKIDPPRLELERWNGLGGFAADGREYVTVLSDGKGTPAPWINVVANPGFGFQVSESGSGYTWSGNSRENQLTPWSNDPVSDPPGEAIFVRDDATGETWSPTPLPIREATPYVIRHGQGYSLFAHESHGIALELTQLVPEKDPIKVSRLRIENRTHRRRAITVAAYAEWVLGSSRQAAAPYLITSLEKETGALLARNPWNDDFGRHVAFLDLGGRQKTWTGDRTEFLGRNGSLAAPAGLAREAELSGRLGAGLDPCGALAGTFTLAPGEVVEVVVLLGQARDAAEARELVVRYRAASVDALLDGVKRRWGAILGTLQVKTPDRAMDLLLNGWLLYQTIVCRLWARSAFYQAGGAYGFRDQLQDVMAVLVAAPSIAREHLLRSAARQFPEGDVQHWWHPPSGKGVRTRISDDLLFLPYVAAYYVRVTGDSAILDELVPFIDGAPLGPREHEAYFEPRVSTVAVTLFEHAARALDRSLAVGSHGLPLMGTGDWNDGMNRVGQEGKGESVWLAWFLIANLESLATIAGSRGEPERAGRWRTHARALKEAIEREAWDGAWYLRAFFDDGTALGSAKNEECRIDSIAQSWSVLSGAGDPARSDRAMASLEELLVKKDEGLVLLLTPPFDRTPNDPGYIRGYVPGIRENGGQYTHAAVWVLLARAGRGEGDAAGELFRLLNPIERTGTPAALDRYKVEPYVLAGDVYGVPPHVGRGGWTWYTGSAGWLHRAGTEALLGFQLRGGSLVLDPCIPRSWPRFELVFRHRETRYEITVTNPDHVSRGVAEVTLDGRASTREVPLVDDGATHRVTVRLGREAPVAIE